MVRAEILSQGDEVITGQVADTNAAWLAERLTDLGFEIVRHSSVGDRPADIRDLFREAASRADLVVCTGGLGPTEDDLTAAALAEAFGRPLVLDEEALAHIRGLYRRFGRDMPEVNRKQAMLPTGARRLDNEQGTAPGFVVEAGEGLVACMPGVPREMRAMWTDALEPIVRERFEPKPWPLVTLRTTGIGESNLQERLGPTEDERFVLSYRTKLPENHVKLRFRPEVPEDERRRVAEELRARIGSPVFAVEGLGEPGGPLEVVVGRLLAEQGATLALAEEASGGHLAALCRLVEDSETWLVGGFVSAIGPGEEAALAAAEKTRRRFGTDFGLATGGPMDDPPNQAAIALAGESLRQTRVLRYVGGGERQQGHSAGAALDLLRRHLDTRRNTR